MVTDHGRVVLITPNSQPCAGPPYSLAPAASLSDHVTVRVTLPPLGDAIDKGGAMCPLRASSLLGVQQPQGGVSRRDLRVRVIIPFRRSHIFAVRGGMMVVSGDVAIKGRASGSSHGLSALTPRGRNGGGLWFAIGFLFREDPIRRFGEMAGQGPDGLLVAFARGDALVEASDVAVRGAAAIEADRVGGFDEGPLEIAVDVGAGRTEARLPTAGVDARRRARIGGQLLGGGEACDVADLEGDHHGERDPHARQSQQALNRRGWLEQGPEPLLELTH